MRKNKNNFVFIDGVNLYKGIAELNWQLDYKRFRVWLAEKFGVKTAYIFLGFIGTNSDLYRDLQNWGYIVVFKPTLPNDRGEIKGNCDAEMVLQAVSDMYEGFYERAIIVSGDGDFACLVRFLKDRGRFEAVLSPNHKKASVLLRRSASDSILFLDHYRNRLEFKRNNKPPK